VLAYFAAATGADVRYTGSDSFEQQIVVDAEAGSAPNVAVFPQPGLAADMAARGFLTPLPDGTWRTGWRELCRRPVLGRSGHLRRRERRQTSSTASSTRSM
jgi:hypothetical protein